MDPTTLKQNVDILRKDTNYRPLASSESTRPNGRKSCIPDVQIEKQTMTYDEYMEQKNKRQKKAMD